jgi:hypothetical protein
MTRDCSACLKKLFGMIAFSLSAVGTLLVFGVCGFDRSFFLHLCMTLLNSGFQNHCLKVIQHCLSIGSHAAREFFFIESAKSKVAFCLNFGLVLVLAIHVLCNCIDVVVHHGSQQQDVLVLKKILPQGLLHRGDFCVECCDLC